MVGEGFELLHHVRVVGGRGVLATALPLAEGEAGLLGVAVGLDLPLKRVHLSQREWGLRDIHATEVCPSESKRIGSDVCTTEACPTE